MEHLEMSYGFQGLSGQLFVAMTGTIHFLHSTIHPRQHMYASCTKAGGQ